MKTTYTIAAIAMFAVILGMSALAPAMAIKPDADGKHKIEFCHYQEAKTTDRDGNDLDIPIPEAYLVIEVDNKGKMNGHFKGLDQIAHHFPVDELGEPTGAQGDFLFEDEDVVDVNDSEADCIALNDALGN